MQSRKHYKMGNFYQGQEQDLPMAKEDCLENEWVSI